MLPRCASRRVAIAPVVATCFAIVALTACAPHVESDATASGGSDGATNGGAPFTRTFPLVDPRSLSVSDDGDVVLAGVGSPAVFHGAAPSEDAETTPRWFVVDFDRTGKIRWSLRIESVKAKTIDAQRALGLDCVALHGGGAACGGYFSATLRIGDDSLVCDGPYTCSLVVVLDASGRASWTRSTPSSSPHCENWTASVSADASENLVVVQNGRDPAADFNGYCHATLQRFDRDGHLTFERALPWWLTQAREVEGRVDADGDVFITGACEGANFDGVATGCDIHLDERLLAKLDRSSGRVKWIKSFWWGGPVSLAPSVDGGVVIAGQAVLPHPDGPRHPEIIDLDAAGDARFDAHLHRPVEYGASGGSIAHGLGGTLYATPTRDFASPMPSVQLFALDATGTPKKLAEIPTDNALVAVDPDGRAVVAAAFTGSLTIGGASLSSKEGELVVADFAY